MQGVALLGRPKFLDGVWDGENGTLYRGHRWVWFLRFLVPIPKCLPYIPLAPWQTRCPIDRRDINARGLGGSSPCTISAGVSSIRFVWLIPLMINETDGEPSMSIARGDA